MGVDYDHRIVTVVKERFAKDNKRGVFAVADGTKLPFKDCSFDKVSCSEVLEHVPEYKKALKEINRVMKPGAKAVVTIPNRHSLKGIVKRYHSFINRVFNRCDLHPYDEWKTREELKTALRESGLEVQEELGVDFTPQFFRSPALRRISIGMAGFVEDKIKWSLPGCGNILAMMAVKGPLGKANKGSGEKDA